MRTVPNKTAIVAGLEELVAVGLRKKDFSRSRLVRSSAHIVLPFDVPTVETLYSKGIDVEGPILHEYPFKWHRPLPAFKHQLFTADRVTKLRSGFIFNEIGTAKTLSVLWAADYLQSKGMVNKVLVVCTLSTTHLIWADTIFKSFPHRSYALLYGSKARRIKELERDVDYYIINHDGLKVMGEWKTVKDKTYLLSTLFDSRPDIDMIIVDESAIFRNARTDLFKSMDWIANIKGLDRRLWLMTGNPTPGKPTDIWAQARLVKKDLFHKSFVRFRHQVMHKVTEFKWVPNLDWEKFIYDAIGPYCVRFKRDDCIDMPPVVTQPRECEMSKQQVGAYKKMMDTYTIEMNNKLITAANQGVKLNKLLQIACGCVYDRDGEAHNLDCKPKLKVLFEVVEESGSKLIVYTPFKHSIAMLLKHLEKQWSVGVVNGDVSMTKRNEIFYAFQEGDLEIILAHPKAMAHGLDLTRSHTICWWTPIDDFEIDEQANGRITRPGQIHTQTIVRLIASPVEKKVYQRNDAKEKMGGLLLNLLTDRV